MKSRIGDWLISILHGNDHIPESPFRVRVREPSRGVNVRGLEDKMLGRLANFSIETSGPTDGDLTVDITYNGRIIPAKIEGEGPNRYHINFSPVGSGTYIIRVYFSGVEVQGSPYTMEVIDANDVVASGDALSSAEISRRATFFLNLGINGSGNDVKAVITSPRGLEVPVAILDNRNGNVAIEFIPTEVGEHQIDVFYFGKPIARSPFHCQVFDRTKVNVLNLPNTGFVGKPVEFDTDCWMECDDLKNWVCKYSDVPLAVPSSQIHIVMWEKQSENSGYRLPSEKEPVKRNDERTELEPVSNVKANAVSPGVKQPPAVTPPFPFPAMTSFPAVVVEKFCERSSPSPSCSSQDGGSSRMTRKSLETCSRLERMRQKFELDKRRLSSGGSGRPAIARIPAVVHSNGEHLHKASTSTTIQKSGNPNPRFTNTELLNGQNIPPGLQDAVCSDVCRNSSRKARGEGDSRRKKSLPEQIYRSTRTKSMLKVGQHSYLDAILPLIKGQPTSSAQKFEGYIPKSQKLTTVNVSEGCELGRKTPVRKPKVCFSDTNINDGNVQADVSDPPENLHLRGLSRAVNGILSKPNSKSNSKSSLRSKLPAQNVAVDENHCDVSLELNDECLDLVNGFDLDRFLDNAELELDLLADSAVRIPSNADIFDAMSASAVTTSSFENNSHSVTATFNNGTMGGCSSEPMHCPIRIDQPQKYASVVNGFSDGKPSNELSKILAAVSGGSGDSAHPAGGTIASGYASCAEAGLVAESDSIFPDLFEFSNVHSFGFDSDWPVF